MLDTFGKVVQNLEKDLVWELKELACHAGGECWLRTRTEQEFTAVMEGERVEGRYCFSRCDVSDRNRLYTSAITL